MSGKHHSLIFWFFLSEAALGFYSCTKDIVEPDMTKQTVVLLAPANSYTTTVLTHLFWWEDIKDAEKYNLQIVSPAFSSVQALLLDTNISTNKFSFTLLPGQFQWRVKAFNSSSESAYSTFNLYIDSTFDLSGQTVVLQSPVNALVTKAMTHTFKWDTIYSADEYRFQVINASSQTIIDVLLTKDSTTYTLNEGTYTWQVRAQNATSNSPYSSRTITIDTTAPAPPTLVFPAYNDTLTGTDSLKWTYATGSVGDSLYIYPDSLFSSVSFAGYFTTTTYYMPTGALNQDYFWRMKSRDVAGNWSVFTPLRKYWLK